jgi:hypothetical protein
MAIGLWAGAISVSLTLSRSSLDRMRMDSPDLRAWVLVMVIQSIPYLSAILASIVSALPLPARWIGVSYTHLESDEDYATIVDAPTPTDTPTA